MSDLFDPPGRPFTLPHFVAYCGAMIFDDGKKRNPEPWQRRVISDLFAGVKETWLIVPEGNGKTTLMAQLVLYGADHARSPWIPLGAASREQAEIIYTQARGFVESTDWLAPRFRCYDGYRKIMSTHAGGRGIQVYAADVKTGDGVIPYPYAIVDELHRHDDLRLYSLWKGKLRKRGAQILTISTAGEPETEFELMRDEIRRKADRRRRRGAYLRAYGPNLVLHEYQVQSDEDCLDIRKVKQANPLRAITTTELRGELSSPTFNLGDWKRLKCNRPTRSSITAISDKEFDDSDSGRDDIPAGKRVNVGLDVGWKWDTTALMPLWIRPQPKRAKQAKRLLGPAVILVPPRDGSTLHPDEIKYAFEQLNERTPIDVVVMDTSKAEDIAAWLEDELGVAVVDREQSNTRHVRDYEAFMDGLRNKTLEHCGDDGFRSHALNAIARRLPGGDYRFDRPIASRRSVREQDRRVIDALTAAGMVVEESTNDPEPEPTSVYERRGLFTV